MEKASKFDKIKKLVDRVQNWRFNWPSPFVQYYAGNLDSGEIEIIVGKNSNEFYLRTKYCGKNIEDYESDDQARIKNLYKKIDKEVYEIGKKRLEKIANE